MRVGGVAQADVADGRRYQYSIRAAQRAQHDFDGKLAAVLAARRQLDAGADLLREGPFGGSQAVRDQALCEAIRNDAADLLSQQLVAAIAELFLRLQIH